jgi:hypothetical protein
MKNFMEKLLRRIFQLLVLGFGSAVQGVPLVIDHTSVDKFSELTQADIDRVKTMFVEVLGASHSRGYRTGCEILESVDSRFPVNVTLSGTPEAYTTNYLRMSGGIRSQYNQWSHDGIGEDFWYSQTNPPVNPLTTISYAHSNNLTIAAIAFGWSWQPTWQNSPGGGVDPVHQVRWAGSSFGGPDGNLRWGLDDEDDALTGNRVSMNTYLRATQSYIDYCTSNNIPTKVFFTTGPPDGDGGDGEKAYQRHLKYEHIRNYVAASTNAILLDYADILCWSDGGQQSTVTWTDFGSTLRTIPQIHLDNYKNLDGSDGSGSNYHLGERGALRLAKALWYMLAQISADTNPTVRPVLEVNTISSETIQLQFVGSSNTAYVVEFSSDLLSGSWQTLTNFSAQPFDQTNQIADSPTSIVTHRFYRVRAE